MNLKSTLMVAALLLPATVNTLLAQGHKTPQFVAKNGIGLVMPDSSFSINFRFRTQNRD